MVSLFCYFVCFIYFSCFVLTEADKTGNTHTTDRHLDKKLVLLVKQNLGNQSHWVLPQSEWQEGESLREVC